MLRTVGQCQLALYRGVPMLQAFSISLIRIGGSAKLIALDRDLDYKIQHENKKWREVVPSHVDNESRTSFALAWGLSPSQQMDYEEMFSRLKPFQPHGKVGPNFNLGAFNPFNMPGSWPT